MYVCSCTCVYMCVCVLCAVCIWYNSPVFRDPNTDPSEHLTNYIYNTCTNVNNYTTLYIQYSCEYYENKDDEISMCVCVCVRVRVCMCSSKILENHQSRNTKKKKKKKRYGNVKGRGDGSSYSRWSKLSSYAYIVRMLAIYIYTCNNTYITLSYHRNESSYIHT